MAKKNKAKVVQMLSPENYIRQKGRTLPIYECWVNTDWDENKLASIIVARKHTNENFTIGIYLVDLNCLGVKNADCFFNISYSEYRDILEQSREEYDISSVEYTLVHNIVYAGIEYAEEFGFEPHKKFEIARFLLEEDTDEIDLIEIECGHNGTPMYVSGPSENKTRVNQIIAQLEKTAGSGNYTFVDGESNDYSDSDFSDIWDNEKWENDNNRFDKMKLEEKLKLFAVQMNSIENGEEDDYYFNSLINSIIDECIKHEEVDRLYHDFIAESKKFEITEEVTDEFLFGTAGCVIDSTEIKIEFLQIYEQIFDDTKAAQKRIEKLQKKYPKTPALFFLELIAYRTKNSSKYEKRLPSYAAQFPEYSLLKILKQISMLDTDYEYSENFSFKESIEHFFKGRNHIQKIEMFNLFMYLIFRATVSGNLEEAEAIVLLSEDLGLNEEDLDVLNDFERLIKMNFILALIHEIVANNTNNKKKAKKFK